MKRPLGSILKLLAPLMIIFSQTSCDVISADDFVFHGAKVTDFSLSDGATVEMTIENKSSYKVTIVGGELTANYKGEPIGSISVVNFDDRVDMVEIGFCIGRNWWSQGIMTEAFQTVIDFLFGEVGVQRIEAGHDPNNPASGAVQRKCGLKYEGTLRRSIRSNQGITDKVVYAILKEEWKK